ncbi:diguanylate cyclase [Paucibacter sp. APW11]|uniref:diguanylate cyclase n=1 Tax=Roseateles aquae TaxID=3077235 RepID=A0ABU3PB40_9BURK|nr:diguanylate cyclase [Paucibacter sp. APW11]MDT8999323.1 diguanylate cyclase [Paucibacter sp. APW11]
MDERRPPSAPRSGAALPPAQLAKAAFLRLATAKLEPTPENYARAYAAEAGQEAASSEGWPERAQPVLAKLLSLGVSEMQARHDISSALREGRWDDTLRILERIQDSSGPAVMADTMAGITERLIRGLERGGRQWTVARKKDGLQRVLESNRSDPQRLLSRLRQLVNSWDSDVADASVETDEEAGGTPSQFFSEEEMLAPATSVERDGPGSWPEVSASLHQTVQHALPALDERANALKLELEAALLSLREQGANANRAQNMEQLCVRARRMLEHRHHLFGQLGSLCKDLSASLVELAEDDSWARGQCEVMVETLEQGVSSRGVRMVNEMLSGTRERQRGLREERSRARDSLKLLIHRMLEELAELGQHTDRFQNNVGRYAEVIERADTLESLAGVVREMVEESRTVQSLVHQTQSRINDEHERASTLSKRVDELEDELRKLSSEVQTDQLTKIANRRGLEAAFNTEQAKLEREGSVLALALLDVDNFKKLNDTLGHAAGDVALSSLAARVTQMLRPGDLVARYGGEEFVLMLPRTPLDEAQQVLTRLQRSLSAALFMHEGKDVFVTFSAGITLYRLGEKLEEALDRADEGLYEAKRTGKNRACIVE